MAGRGEEQRVDWFRVLDDLKRHDLSLQQIADEIFISKSTLLLYKDGSEPAHTKGENLLALWVRVTGKHRSEIPLGRVYLSVSAAK